MAFDLQSIKQHLECKDDVTEALDSLNTLLVTKTSPSFVSEVISAIPLSVLFSCLQTDDHDQLHLTCSILDKLLCYLPASQLVDFGQYVEIGLQYSGVRVAKTCLQALLRLCDDEMVEDMILAPTMLHLITQILGGEDLECASVSAKLLLRFSAQPEKLVGRMKQGWLAELEQLLALKDTIRFRVYDLVIQTCLQGGVECFMMVRENSRILEGLVGELETDDPLVKMNAIEILGSLVYSDEGVVFLHTVKILDKLYSTLQNSQHDVLGKMILPAILKFFGQMFVSVGCDVAVVCKKYPDFLVLTLEGVLSPHDQTLWGVCIDTFGLLTSTQAGRMLLSSNEQLTENVMKKVGEFIANSSSEVRCRAMNAVEMMASYQEDCSVEDSTSRRWFFLVHPNLFQLLLSLARQPFSDLRLASLGVMVSMAAQNWGQCEMQACPGFLEYLLDRSTEPDKEGKELKYEVVHRIVESKKSGIPWTSSDLIKMRKYDREGPFHYTGDTTVAMEGGSS